MRPAKINYVGSTDLEYTEIRPVRPNQSVILAGLGVTGNKVMARTKDRQYRSSQGAGYSDGLVIHTGRSVRSQLWPDKKETSKPKNIPLLNSIYADYDVRDRRLYEDEIFVPLSSSSSSPQLKRPTTSRSRTQSVSPVRSVHKSAPNLKTVATTYDMFFDQHLQNIVNLEDERRSRQSFSSSSTTPVTARYRSAGSQTPTDFGRRLSPFIQTKINSSQTDLSVPKIIKDCLEEELEEDHEDLDVLTDDELDMIGDFMVKESLDTATNKLDNLKVRKRFKFICIFQNSFVRISRI